MAWAHNRYFLGMRIIGVCIFAYGIAYYAEKTAIVADGEKRERMNEDVYEKETCLL